MTDRYNANDIRRWREDGFAIIPGFFSEQEIAPLRADYDRLYGGYAASRSSAPQLPVDIPGMPGQFRPDQFGHIDTLPYDGSTALNLISLHPALISFAKALLGVPTVYLYQSHTWAKFTGETDYEQPFHCDFGNHTLLVPSDEPALRTVDFIFYISDVTDEDGALHYVTKQDAAQVLGPGRLAAEDPDRQQALQRLQCSAAGPAGTLVAHGIDTFHRGTNLTRDGGYRYTMTVGYKAAGNDMIGYNVWQQSSERDWRRVLNHATPEQLECLGIPMPGHPYWTLRTLKLTQARWPDWDMAVYFSARNG